MSKPIIHARSSAQHFGGKPQDYLDIHEFLDSSRQAFSDLRHRALTHNSWFITNVLPRVFGATRTNSAGRIYTVTEVGERHVHEDYNLKFIPTAQDFLRQILWLDWMENGKEGMPESAQMPKGFTPKKKEGVIARLLKLPPKGKKPQMKPIEPVVDPMFEPGVVGEPMEPIEPGFYKHPCNFD